MRYHVFLYPCRKTNRKSGNAFNASASVFEVLSDVDTKFSKFVDKECDVVSGEVKKWFKKLVVRRKRIVPNCNVWR